MGCQNIRGSDACKSGDSKALGEFESFYTGFGRSREQLQSQSAEHYSFAFHGGS